MSTLADVEEFEGCVNLSTFCSLRDAINRANENAEEKDTVNFELITEGPIELASGLPEIVDPLLIDGTTATNYVDAPVIEIDASQAVPEYGLVVRAGDTEIRGLSITGVPGPAVNFELGGSSWACGNYLGVDPSGAAAANGAGVLIGDNTTGTKVGGPGCANLISGNDGPGIIDEGFASAAFGNLIGTDPSGKGPLPNEGPGIEFTAASGSGRAAADPGGGPANTIAFNEGPGVLVEDGGSIVAIFENSIFDNSGAGIEILAGDAPSPPTIEAATLTPSASITFTVVGEPETQYDVDLYANSACDPSGFGEGRSWIGFESVTTDASGIGKSTAADLFAAPPGQEVITATASANLGEGGYSTSEFSKCFSKAAPPDLAPPPPIPSVTTQKALVPENGETLAAEPKSGTIYIKVPGQKKQTKLKEGQLIPVGSVIDATNGKVTLTSVNKAGETQTAVFYGGKFLVAQKDGSGLVVLKLQGGNFNSCKGSARSSGATASGRAGRRLWGSGKGKFRTEGSYGSATVRGTVWLTEDRCGGTFFKTKKGVVSIRDFAAGTNFSLPAGKSYLAKKEG
ncbi:MAG: hypothetical protein AB7T48_04165 [Solirubrobacterales bacterium]